jgi:acyl dehydratase
MQEIRFDDVAALSALVTEEFGPWSPPLEVTQDMIDRFADLTGDRQWIHVDVERARRESPFGGPAAHGFLTLSLLPSLRPGRTFAIVGHGSVINYGSDGFRFLAPVPAGSRIHARSRLAAVEAKPKGTLVTTETAIHVVGSDKPSLLYKGLVLYGPQRR